MQWGSRSRSARSRAAGPAAHDALNLAHHPDAAAVTGTSRRWRTRCSVSSGLLTTLAAYFATAAVGGRAALAAVREPDGDRRRGAAARRPDGGAAQVGGAHGAPGARRVALAAGRWPPGARRRARLRPRGRDRRRARRSSPSPARAGPGAAPAGAWWPPAAVAGRRGLRPGRDRGLAAPAAAPPAAAAGAAGAAAGPGSGWSPRRPLAAAAVAGIVVFRQQGTQPGAGVNLYTSAAPVLVAVPAVIVVLRVYPLVLRGLLRGFARPPGAHRVPRPRPGGADRAHPGAARVRAGPRAHRGRVRRHGAGRGDQRRGRRVLAGRRRRRDDHPACLRFPDFTVPPAAARAIAAVPGVTHAAAVVAGQLEHAGRRAAHRHRRRPGELRGARRGRRRLPAAAAPGCSPRQAGRARRSRCSRPRRPRPALGQRRDHAQHHGRRPAGRRPGGRRAVRHARAGPRAARS